MQVAVSSRRSVVIDSSEGFSIIVPAKRNPFILLFLGAWLVGWCFGEIFAARQILAGTAQWSTLFLIAWLIMWTGGGALAIYTWLWTAFGKEKITLRPGALVIKRDVIGFGRPHEYELAHVKKLRVAQQVSDPLGRANSMRVWGLGPGALAFDYGAKTVRFAGGVDEAEASMIISDLRLRHAFGEG
jgi:hypothetical protein